LAAGENPLVAKPGACGIALAKHSPDLLDLQDEFLHVLATLPPVGAQDKLVHSYRDRSCRLRRADRRLQHGSLKTSVNPQHPSAPAADLHSDRSRRRGLSGRSLSAVSSLRQSSIIATGRSFAPVRKETLTGRLPLNCNVTFIQWRLGFSGSRTLHEHTAEPHTEPYTGAPFTTTGSGPAHEPARLLKRHKSWVSGCPTTCLRTKAAKSA